MKTDDLISLLAAGAGPIDRYALGRRYGAALACGALVSALLMLGVLGVRPDLDEAARRPMFWGKLLFVAALGGGSLLAALRLSRPGRRLGGVPAALVAPVLVMWAMAGMALAGADPNRRMALFLGETWWICPFLIAMLSLPVFLAVLWAMRDLAPTRLPLAGTAAGLLAGTTGALVYCLHCPEMEAPFLGSWYLLGMLIPALAGGLLGRPLLRW